MKTQEKIKSSVLNDYKDYDINNDDDWHIEVDKKNDETIYQILDKIAEDTSTILNVGSAGKTYTCKGKLINMDVVKETISNLENYIVGSAENIPLKDDSIDILICVGSVLNYTDCKKSIKEFARVLKKQGTLILEFERSNSAEFLFTKKHNKEHFIQEYEYHNKKHLLNMYSEKFVTKLLKENKFAIRRKKRFHIMSTLLYRMHFNENNVHKYIKYDWVLKPLSYQLAHNCILICTIS